MLVGEATSVVSVLLDENLEVVIEDPEFGFKMRSGLGVGSSCSEADGLHSCPGSSTSSIAPVNIKEIPITQLDDVDKTATDK